MARATVFRSLLILDDAPAQLADVVVPGVYQLGGNTEPIVWSVYNKADRNGQSPTLPAGQVHTMWMPRGAQIFCATNEFAGADTNASLWLVIPDDE
jgi:hypothetical protein